MDPLYENEFRQVPNCRGYFFHNNYWATYTCDEHNFCQLTGPFSDCDLPSVINLLTYQENKTPLAAPALDIYINNHFTSRKVMDDYVTNNYYNIHITRDEVCMADNNSQPLTIWFPKETPIPMFLDWLNQKDYLPSGFTWFIQHLAEPTLTLGKIESETVIVEDCTRDQTLKGLFNSLKAELRIFCSRFSI